jgi:TPR repeat protein
MLYAIGLFYSQPTYPLPTCERALNYLMSASEQGHAAAQFMFIKFIQAIYLLM